MTLQQTVVDITGGYNPATLSFLDKKTLVSWDCTLSMDDGPTANINVVNVNEFDNVDNLQKEVKLFLEVNGTTTLWFVGNPQSFECEVNHATNVMTIKCTSFLNRLEMKPINTYTFDPTLGYDTYVQPLIEEICFDFLGLPDDGSIVDISSSGYGNALEKITISEENSAHALKQLAQAFGCELFINKDGKLTNDAFKTGASTVDVKIPDEYLITSKKVITEEEGFSAVRVRGRYTSLDELGLVNVHNNTHSLNINYDGTYYQMDLYVQNANIDELRNAVYTSSTPGINITLNQIYGNGKIQVNIARTPAFTVGTYTVNISISVRRIPWNEAAGFANNRLTTPKSMIVNSVYTIKDFTTVPRTQNIGPRYRSDKSADEKEDNRIDLTVIENTLVTKYGIRWLEIDNPYIDNQTVALYVAERAFVVQEQAKHTWQLDIAYMAEIDLNMVVEWTRADTKDTLIGVVRKINLAWQASDSSIRMSLIVEEFISD